MDHSIFTSKNGRRTSGLPTNATSMLNQATRSSHNDENLIIEQLLSELKCKIEEIENCNEKYERETDLNQEENNCEEDTLHLLVKSLQDFVTEFPKFKKYIDFVREKYNSVLKELFDREKLKTQILRQNISKLRSQLDYEFLQKTKLSKKLESIEVEVRNINLFS